MTGGAGCNRDAFKQSRSTRRADPLRRAQPQHH
jgi:hypothetical protein